MIYFGKILSFIFDIFSHIEQPPIDYSSNLFNSELACIQIYLLDNFSNMTFWKMKRHIKKFNP